MSTETKYKSAFAKKICLLNNRYKSSIYLGKTNSLIDIKGLSSKLINKIYQ